MSVKFRHKVLIQRSRLSEREDVITILTDAEIGDWFLLYMLCKNMDPLHYRELVAKLASATKDEDESDNDEEKKLINNDGENYQMESTKKSMKPMN